MKSAYERDKDVFVFAALHNRYIVAGPDTGRLFETQLTEKFDLKYVRRFEQLKREIRNMRELEDGWLKTHAIYYGWLKDDELYDKRLKRIDNMTLSLQAKIGELARKPQILQANFQTILLIVAIAAAAIIWFAK
jgi:hypothetical protein